MTKRRIELGVEVVTTATAVCERCQNEFRVTAEEVRDGRDECEECVAYRLEVKAENRA